MQLGWHRNGPGYYVSVTARTRYTVRRADYRTEWTLLAGERFVSLHATLHDAQAAAQLREDAIGKHLRIGGK